MKVRKFPQTIKKFYHLPKYENSVVIQLIKANNGYIINVVVAKEPIKNIQQIIDAYIDKIIVYQNEIKVQLNFFPDFSLKLEKKEKDCPITEGVLDLQGQSNSRLISKNADRIE